jgi:hypothetical protein
MGIRIQTEITQEDERTSRVLLELQSKIPTNDLGFPIGFYRADLLPFHDYLPEQAAIQELFSPSSTSVSGGDPNAEREGQVEDEVEAAEVSVDLSISDEDILADLSDQEIEDMADPDDLENTVNELEAVKTRLPATASPVVVDSRVCGFRRQDLASSFVQLNYDEGFPGLPSGQPFWKQLEHEPGDAWICFQAYLQMPQIADGIRTLAGLPLVMEQNQLLDLDGKSHEDFTAKMRVYFQLYYWASRTKAYDFYKIAAARKAMEHRATSVQDIQYGMSSRLMTKLGEYMESDEEFWDMMTPKVAIDMFRVMAHTQRVNSGLPGAAPPTEKTQTGMPGASIEMILRTLSRKANDGATVTVDESGNNVSGQPLAARILNDKGLTELAQELVLKLNGLTL